MGTPDPDPDHVLLILLVLACGLLGLLDSCLGAVLPWSPT